MDENAGLRDGRRIVFPIMEYKLEHEFYENHALYYFDPLRVKVLSKTKDNGLNAVYPTTIKYPDRETEETCSKVRNQLTHQHSENFRFNTPRNLRIVLGHACNFRCKYCSQKKEYLWRPTIYELENFMRRLDENLLYDELQLVQFWGGEPLLYWDAIKWLMREFKKRFKISGAGFSIASNGSLLNWAITKDIMEEKDFGFILSHDGPGQKLRGPDPLDPEKESGQCLRFLARVKDKTNPRNFLNQGRNFAVNPVITSWVHSYKELVDWYDNTFGIEVPIAECIPMIPIQPNTAQYAPDDFMDAEEDRMRELLEIGINRFDSYKLLYSLFCEKLTNKNFNVNPTKATCFTTDPYMLTVDMDGNILPCQTYDASQKTMPDGSPCVSGHLSLMDVRCPPEKKQKLSSSLPPLHNWVEQEKCKSCEVVSFCMGGCPYLIGTAAEVDCESKKGYFRILLRTFLSELFRNKVYVPLYAIRAPESYK